MALRFAALLLALAVGAPAGHARSIPGGPFPNVGPPLLLRLEGALEASPDAARGKGFTVVSLALLGSDEQRWLAVTEARTFGGDQPLSGKDVIDLVAPFRPNFLLAGPAELMSALRGVPPGARVRIEGLVDPGSRTYYLRRVERDPEGSAR